MSPENALGHLPDGLRKEFLSEYRRIIQNYYEHRWSDSELGGGRLCEIVYCILDGHAKNSYPTKASKPGNMLDACRALESNTQVPRSFRILIPRLLPALYEVRNQRNVGHVGGDVDPSYQDATLVISISNWIFGELIRVFHKLSLSEAQKVVDKLAERPIPLVWQGENVKRVLDPNMSLPDQVLVLLASSSTATATDDLFAWTESTNRAYFSRMLKTLHKARKINISNDGKTAEILQPGLKQAEEILRKSTGA